MHISTVFAFGGRSPPVPGVLESWNPVLVLAPFPARGAPLWKADASECCLILLPPPFSYVYQDVFVVVVVVFFPSGLFMKKGVGGGGRKNSVARLRFSWKLPDGRKCLIPSTGASKIQSTSIF